MNSLHKFSRTVATKVELAGEHKSFPMRLAIGLCCSKAKYLQRDQAAVLPPDYWWNEFAVVLTQVSDLCEWREGGGIIINAKAWWQSSKRDGEWEGRGKYRGD